MDDFSESLKNAELEARGVSPEEFWRSLQDGVWPFAILPAAPLCTKYERVVIDQISLLIEALQSGLGVSYLEGRLGWGETDSGSRWDAVLIRGRDSARSSQLLLAQARLLALRYQIPAFLFHPNRERTAYRVDSSGIVDFGHLGEGPDVLLSRLVERRHVSIQNFRRPMGILARRIYALRLKARGEVPNTGYELIRDDSNLRGKSWLEHAIRSESHQRALAERFGLEALVHACRTLSVKVLIPVPVRG